MWDVVVRRELRPVIDALAGKRTGYGDAYAQLQRGVRLKWGYRLAFTMGPSTEKKYQGCVHVLYVGERDTRDRTRDAWQIVHDLFGVENPPADHDRPPCCDSGLPVLDEQELADFMAALRKLL